MSKVSGTGQRGENFPSPETDTKTNLFRKILEICWFSKRHLENYVMNKCMNFHNNHMTRNVSKVSKTGRCGKKFSSP